MRRANLGFIASIVEGHGEVVALPILLRRIAKEKKGCSPEINPPFRVPASSFLKLDGEFKRAVALTAAKAKAKDGIVLILLDCEDECPGELGPKILKAAYDTRSDTTYIVCLAKREYETWLLFGARSLSGFEGLPNDLAPLEDPETRRDAKGWLRDKMAKKYIEIQHQAAFTSKVDLDQMRDSPSFRRLVDRLLPYL